MRNAGLSLQQTDPGKVRVLLLVDDEANVLSALKRVLQNGDYQILIAHSGEEALEILAGSS